jgi:hypothetical protein
MKRLSDKIACHSCSNPHALVGMMRVPDFESLRRKLMGELFGTGVDIRCKITNT